MSEKTAEMKLGSTMLLRAAILVIGLTVLGLCAVALPVGIASDQTGMYKYILMGLYIPAVPFFYALQQTLKLLGYIDKNKAFSESSVQALKRIKYCAVAISALFTAGMPYIFYVADKDDAPGVAAVGFVIIGASFVIAATAGVFQRLVQHAVDIKSEHDLTV